MVWSWADKENTTVSQSIFWRLAVLGFLQRDGEAHGIDFMSIACYSPEE
jgi:hypothetical protein